MKILAISKTSKEIHRILDMKKQKNTLKSGTMNIKEWEPKWKLQKIQKCQVSDQVKSKMKEALLKIRIN